MENLQGTLLKGYKLEERIGNGGFGAVYRAKQPTIGREVAVKIILPGYANNPDFIRRFESEAHLIARLEHPHITPLHDFWRDPDGAYLIMRYLRGGSVRDSLQISAYELNAVSQLLDQIAAALDFAHRNNVIHRDIKPGNILLDEDGNAYLADFGIAKDLAGITDNKTAVDAVVGSLDYISPEQARSELVTPRTDIYSLGVTLYEMITGEHPFQNSSTIERLYKHINDPLPEIVNLPANTSDVVNEIIMRATAKNPEDRYPDVLALAVAFREGIGRNATQNGASIVEQLTMREQEVLSMIAKNMSNREIADELVVTMSTVKWHLNQLYKKMGVRSRVQAIVRARELNLIVNGDTDDGWMPLQESAISVSLPEPENPYKGLHAFQMTDARDFFGRDDLNRKLIDHMRDDDPFHRFLAVVGPSGSGKSSLVKAGLIPALWKGALAGSEKWFVVDMIPGAHPLDKLEIALIRVAAQQTANLREQLQRDERGLLRVADLILPGDDTELVIVVDQFEEVFTLVEDEKERQHFLDLLRVAVSDVRSRVRVIVTLRADYYDRPLHYPDFGELIRSRMETVLPLSAKGLERAVRGPAERVGVTFEQGLVEQIVSAMNYQAGALPLLQYALTELFDRRQGRLLTNESYQQIGGAVGALANRADEIYQSLTIDAQELAHQMFMRLVTLGEGAEDTRRRATHAELLSLTDNTDLMEEVIDQFAAYRLLSLDHDPETRQPTVEVAHEAILREWDRLRGWLNASRDDIRQERAVSRAAEDWKHHQRDVSYLLRGARLEQVEKWRKTTTLTQTPLEQNFIAQSLQQCDADATAESARQAREARLEKRSRNVLRVLVAVFAVAAIISIGFGIFALSERNNADTARDEAQQSAAEFRSVALTFGAQDALNNGQPDVALALAQEAVNMDNPPPEAEVMFLSASNATWMRQLVFASNPDATDAKYLPDGEHIITVGASGHAGVWNLTTGEEIQSLDIDGVSLQRIAIHSDGETIAIGSANETTYLWNIVSGDVQELISEFGNHSSPIFNADGTKLITGTLAHVLIWDMATLSLERSFEAHPEGWFGPTAIRFNSDESLLVTSAIGGGRAIVWDFETGEAIQELDHNAPDAENFAWVWNAQFLNNDEWIITASDLNVTLWNWRSGEIVWQVETPRLAQDISLTPDEQWFIVGLESPPSAQLYHVETGTLIRTYDGQERRVRNVKISPDGRRFISASQGGTVVEWTLWWEGVLDVYPIPLEEVLFIAQHPSQPIIALAVGLTSQALTTGEYDSTVYVVNTDTGEVIQELNAHTTSVGNLIFSPDGRYLLSADDVSGSDTSVYVWDWENGTVLSEFSEHENGIFSIAFSPDGRTVIEGEGTSTANILVRDFETGEVIGSIGEQRSVWDIEWSPDGDSFYVLSETSLARRDATTLEVIQEYENTRSSRIIVTSDGERLIVNGNGTSSRILDTTTGAELFTLDESSEIAISPDGTIIATYNRTDGVLTLWNIETGQRIQRYSAFPPETDAVIAFSYDGSQLISAGRHQLIVWTIPDEFEDLNTWVTENRYIPEFTCEQRDLYQIEPLCDPES